LQVTVGDELLVTVEHLCSCCRQCLKLALVATMCGISLTSELTPTSSVWPSAAT